MSRKSTIIKGTFILTMTGFLTRFIGFFYRVFLSQTFGEEGVGLYQLIFPIYALCFSFTAAGLETAISRTVAGKAASGDQKGAREIMYTGLMISFALSCIMILVVQQNAVFISEKFLGEPRCDTLLIAMSYAFPFASVHSCIVGYYLGLKQTGIPALSQLVEQVVRVASVYVMFVILTKQSMDVTVMIAVLGLVFGEICSCLFCVRALTSRHALRFHGRRAHGIFSGHVRELVPHAIPLTANRVLLNILQSVESVSIPGRLMLFGLTNSEALSLYGVLTGMALPCILFPSAITNSISTMLLPTVAEIQATEQKSDMKQIVVKVVCCCGLLGLGCCAVFLLFGNWVGSILFGSKSAGKFIVTLAWICPFLYTNNTLISILNGLGKTTTSFFINTVGLIFRIGSVFMLIPVFGIIGYLWGLLGSQLLVTAFCTTTLLKYFKAGPLI